MVWYALTKNVFIPSILNKNIERYLSEVKNDEYEETPFYKLKKFKK